MRNVRNVCMPQAIGDVISGIGISKAAADRTPGAQSPCTKLVMGSGVQSANHPIYVLWTTCSYEGRTANGVNGNHFVPLTERCPETETHVLNIDFPSQTHSMPTRAPTPIPSAYDHTEFDSPQDGTVTDNANKQLSLVTKGQQLAGHFLPTKESIDAIEKTIYLIFRR